MKENNINKNTKSTNELNSLSEQEIDKVNAGIGYRKVFYYCNNCQKDVSVYFNAGGITCSKCGGANITARPAGLN